MMGGRKAIGLKPVPKKQKTPTRYTPMENRSPELKIKFGFKDGVYKVFWDQKNNLLVAEVERDS